jgi:hypothetical protein
VPELPQVPQRSSTKSPRRAAALSLLFGGAGQLYLGQKKKGWLIIALAIVGLPLVVIPGLVVIVLGMVDAYVIGNRLRSGEIVGAWEFFWSKKESSKWKVIAVEPAGISEQIIGVEPVWIDNSQGPTIQKRRHVAKTEWSQSYTQ